MTELNTPIKTPKRPTQFHVLAKPTGAVCNLACKYCFFLSKDVLYPGSSFRVTDEVVEAYIRQTIESQQTTEVTIARAGTRNETTPAPVAAGESSRDVT